MKPLRACIFGHDPLWAGWTDSEKVLLFACASVLVEVPLRVTLLVVQRSAPYLEGPEAHPGPDLAELARVVGCAHEHMMPDLNNVVDILESHYSAAFGLVGRRWQWREQVLQDFDDPRARWRGEALEYEVRVGLGDGTAQAVGNVAPQNDIVEGEGDCGPVRQVGDGHRGRCSSVFVQYDDVGQASAIA